MTRRADNRPARLPVPAGSIPEFAPVPRKRERHDGWTPERQRAFIETLADTGSVASACKAVNMSTVGAYYLRRQPGAESFRAAWDAALDLGVRQLEDVAMDRALNGVDVPVYSYGELVGVRKSYNDRLLMFMLRNRAPERFAKGGGDLKGLNAVGKMEKRRLKAKWRKQWEAEQHRVTPAQIHASIEAKIDEFRHEAEEKRAAHFARLSPETRRAFALYERLKARDEARIAQEDAAAREAAQRPKVTINAKPPREKPVVEEVETWPKWHSLKDESWRK